jgi:hypothetical protein
VKRLTCKNVYQQSFTGQGIGPLFGILLFLTLDEEQPIIPIDRKRQITTLRRNFLFKISILLLPDKDNISLLPCYI